MDLTKKLIKQFTYEMTNCDFVLKYYPNLAYYEEKRNRLKFAIRYLNKRIFKNRRNKLHNIKKLLRER